MSWVAAWIAALAGRDDADAFDDEDLDAIEAWLATMEEER